MRVLRSVSPEEVRRHHSGRSGQHVRDLLDGRCGHRKYGDSYDSYSTCHSYWPLRLPLRAGRVLRCLGIHHVLGSVILCDVRPTYWREDLWGSWRPCAYLHLNLFGVLHECDLCKTWVIRWPGWAPPRRGDR